MRGREWHRFCPYLDDGVAHETKARAPFGFDRVSPTTSASHCHASPSKRKGSPAAVRVGPHLQPATFYELLFWDAEGIDFSRSRRVGKDLVPR